MGRHIRSKVVGSCEPMVDNVLVGWVDNKVGGEKNRRKKKKKNQKKKTKKKLRQEDIFFGKKKQSDL